MAMTIVFNSLLAGLAFMFSASILLQILACALYNIGGRCYLVRVANWFYSGVTFEGNDGWINAAKFWTGASTVGSLAIPIILRHAHMIETPAMWIEFFSFFIFVCTVMCFSHASLEDEW